ncbi:metallophosphoesterase [filamentous cyanobacterium CCP5]|nr:metallophosphoesterase [filamentous cyanobacterium CCP5]
MASILDPPIAQKITKMKERVRWGHPEIVQQGIDQTRLHLEDGGRADGEFSFLVIGDSGSGPHTDHHPQRRVAEQMLSHLEDCRFLLHTGDVVYQVGSSEQYPENFIKPYREWIVGGHQPDTVAYNQMVFQFPFLPVPGNHDYYNLPRIYSLLVQLSRPVSRVLRMKLRPNVGWHGSYCGDAYAQAFIDYLKGMSGEQLQQHLAAHYFEMDGRRGLRYQPGKFTRLPNRYYRFTYGGIDFFALDATTFNAPSPLPRSRDGDRYRRLLAAQREVAEAQKLEVIAEADALQISDPHATERLDDLQAKIEQLDEVLLDLDKQMSATSLTSVDAEQLLWLRDGLIESWHNPAVRGRILFFHYPPYVSETTKVNQGQTLAVRHHLRWVLDEVVEALDHDYQQRPVVDLVLNGHAHCLEYLRTGDTGHADSHMNWIVCGGSGLSLRRQQPEGPEIYETFPSDGQKTGERRLVAKSQVYVGLTGHKIERRRPYSFVRIDVRGEERPQFVVRPYVSERYHQQWHDYALDPLVL